MSMIKSFLKDESGVTAAEYALILAFIVVALIGAAQAAKGSISTALTSAAASL